jgi:hypothetical protein
MYKFGLTWFVAQFKQMLAQLNLLQAGSKTTVTIAEEDFVIQDVKLSPDYRVELLTNAFT